MSSSEPSLRQFLDGAIAYRIPLKVRFRGLSSREGLLVRGPSGWGEFAPFPDYDVNRATRWMAAAIEAAWGRWPSPSRRCVAVNSIVPAVTPEQAARLAIEGGCRTAKVKVAEEGEQLVDDVARVAAVRKALGPSGKIRIDANGAWSVDAAASALVELREFDIEYVEQPCSTLDEVTELRRRTDIPLALDEGIRQATDPLHVSGVREAADLIVVKVAPLGGVASALRVAEVYGLPVVVSSALESSVGLSAGVALAGTLPESGYANGLGTGKLLTRDVTATPLLATDGMVDVRRVDVDVASLDAVRASLDDQQRWQERATVVYRALMKAKGVT